MHSNNDGMDPNFRPSPASDFDAAWAKFYSEFIGVPNIVHVKNWARDLTEKLRAELAESRAFSRSMTETATGTRETRDALSDKCAQLLSQNDLLKSQLKEAVFFLECIETETHPGTGQMTASAALARTCLASLSAQKGEGR